MIAYGENASDLGDYRPGAQAAAEFQVCAPLKEAGLTKAEIRKLSAQLGLPTADKPQSKLWFNDGLWWADMFDTVSQTWHIWRLDRAAHTWVDTGVKTDSRAASRGDTLWDGTHLYVAHNVLASSSTANVSGQPAKLNRYSYNAAAKTYSLDSGFPVNINNYSSESLTLDKDTKGVLWATWTQAQKVYVNATNGTDTAWGTPFALSSSSSVTGAISGAANLSADDLSSLAAYGRSKIGVMWSNQNTSTFYFAVHRDSDPVKTWSMKAAIKDPGVADDHINLKQLEGDDQGHVYAAVKTSKDSTGVSTVAQTMLLGLNLKTGTWDSAIFGTVADCHTRPMIVIDNPNKVLHMFATAPSTTSSCPGSGTPGTIYEKTTPLTALSFPTGRGTPVIRDSASANMNNVTGTKQNVSAASGMVVLASNDATSRYWHADVALTGATGPTASFTTSTTSGVGPLPVTFTDTSTGGVTGWSWNFGDGTTSTSPNPAHTYGSAGTYTATLTVTAPSGSATSSKTITVTAPPVPGKAVAFGGATTNGQLTTATALQLTVPVNTAAGDLLVAQLTVDNAPTVTAPTGWTQLFSPLRPNGASVFAYYRMATAGDAGSTATFTSSVAAKWSGGLARYTGVNPATPLDSSVKTAVSGGATSVTVPAVTTSTSGAMLITGLGINSGSTTSTVPSGTTQSFVNTVGQLSAGAYLATTGTGSQGTRTWSIAKSVELAAWAVALKPA